MQRIESRLSIADTFSNPVRWIRVQLSMIQELVIYLYSVLAVYGALYSHDFTLIYLAVFVCLALGLTHFQIKRAEKKKKEKELQFK